VNKFREIAHAAGFAACDVELDAGEVVAVTLERDNGDSLHLSGRWWRYTPWGAPYPTIGMDSNDLEALLRCKEG